MKHQIFHERSKHINVRHHFVRDKGVVKIVKASTDDNASNMLTKSLHASKLRYCLKLVHLLPQQRGVLVALQWGLAEGIFVQKFGLDGFAFKVKIVLNSSVNQPKDLFTKFQ